MSEHNPIVKTTVLETLNAIIDSLQFISASLSQIESDEDTQINDSTVAGAAHFIRCTKQAAEVCYAQHLDETGKTTGIIAAPNEG